MIKGKFPEIPRFYRTRRKPPVINETFQVFGQNPPETFLVFGQPLPEIPTGEPDNLLLQFTQIMDLFQNLEESKLNELRTRLVRLHEHINMFRPIQAKQLLLMHMRQQIQRKKELIANLKLRIEQATVYLKKT